MPGWPRKSRRLLADRVPIPAWPPAARFPPHDRRIEGCEQTFRSIRRKARERSQVLPPPRLHPERDHRPVLSDPGFGRVVDDLPRPLHAVRRAHRPDTVAVGVLADLEATLAGA